MSSTSPSSSSSSSSSPLFPNRFKPKVSEADDEIGADSLQLILNTELKRIRSRVYTLISTDKKANLEWDRGDWVYFLPALIYHILQQAISCPYCNVLLTSKNVSLDRIDNSLHHTPKNVILTCGPCNIARSNNFSVKEFISVCVLLKSLRGLPPTELAEPEVLFDLAKPYIQHFKREALASFTSKIADSHLLPLAREELLSDSDSQRESDICALLTRTEHTDWIYNELEEILQPFMTMEEAWSEIDHFFDIALEKLKIKLSEY